MNTDQIILETYGKRQDYIEYKVECFKSKCDYVCRKAIEHQKDVNEIFLEMHSCKDSEEMQAFIKKYGE